MQMNEVNSLPSPINIKPPRPETLRAKLISVGLSKPTFTLHRFVETVPVTINPPPIVGDSDRIKDLRAWAFMYECTETNMVRHWGLVERTIDVPDDQIVKLIPHDPDAVTPTVVDEDDNDAKTN